MYINSLKYPMNIGREYYKGPRDDERPWNDQSGNAWCNSGTNETKVNKELSAYDSEM